MTSWPWSFNCKFSAWSTSRVLHYHQHWRHCNHLFISNNSFHDCMGFKNLWWPSLSAFLTYNNVASCTGNVDNMCTEFELFISILSWEVSVRAAAAEIIAADFYAAPTESLLPKKFGSSCRQQNIGPIVCWLAVFQDGGVHMQNMTCFNFITFAKIKWINAKC